jgi:hypothetical protein
LKLISGGGDVYILDLVVGPEGFFALERQSSGWGFTVARRDPAAPRPSADSGRPDAFAPYMAQ